MAAIHQIAAFSPAKVGGGMPSLGGSPAGKASFQDFLSDSLQSAINQQRSSEHISAEALVPGQVELSEVVTSVSQAELTLQTLLSVRDRLVTGWQEVMRMPV
jgi:flagellar hook-basal body complex protein FliE